MKSAFGKPLKIVLLSSVFALTLVVGLMLQTSPVSAASADDIDRAYFLDADQIRVDFKNGTHTLLRDDNINDDTFEYKAASNDHSCDGKLNLPGNSNDGIFNLLQYAYSKPASTTQITVEADIDMPPNCQNIGPPGNSIDLVVGDFQKAKNVFRYEDSGTIRRVDNSSDWVFERSEENPTLYFRTTRTNDNGGRCKDFIQVVDSGNAYRLFDISPDGGGGNLYSDAPPEADGCKYNDQSGDPNHIYGYLSQDGRNRSETLPMGNSDRKPDNIRVISDTERAEIGSTETDDGNGESCEERGGEMGWVFCPVVKALDGFFNWLDSQIQAQLDISQNKYRDENLEATWRAIRNIAYLILVPIVLVLVIGTALGFEIVSAYTVKRALPRLITAVIFIALSWEITGFLVQLSNDVGSGVLGLITFPLNIDAGSGGLTLADMFQSSGTGAAGQVVFSIGIALSLLNPQVLFLLLNFLGSAALILLAAFIVLIARQLFILGLIIFAPIAILAWIFPGNDKPWQFWWGTFSKLLLMFPIITALIGMGRVFAFIIDTTDQNILTPILKLVAYVIPYAMIPLTFKFAGGLIGNIAGIVNDRERGLFDRLKQDRQQRYGTLGNEAKSGNFWRGPARGLNRPTSGLAAGPKGWVTRGGIQASREDALAAGSMMAAESAFMKRHGNNDKVMTAMANKDVALKNMRKAQAEGKLADAATWRQAIALADKGPKTAAARAAAAERWAASGYNFASGEEGYQELAQTMASIHGATLGEDDNGKLVAKGGNVGAYNNAMNSAQYNLKNAGRYDLGGINNGGGYDAEAGIGKADPYSLATRGKTESIQAKGQLMRDSIAEALKAKAAGNMTKYNAEMKKAEVHRVELENGWDSATGANKNAFFKELESINKPPTGPLTPEQTALHQWRESYATDLEATKPPAERVTNAMLARKEARGARRPNPAEIE